MLRMIHPSSAELLNEVLNQLPLAGYFFIYRDWLGCLQAYRECIGVTEE